MNRLKLIAEKIGHTIGSTWFNTLATLTVTVGLFFVGFQIEKGNQAREEANLTWRVFATSAYVNEEPSNEWNVDLIISNDGPAVARDFTVCTTINIVDKHFVSATLWNHFSQTHEEKTSVEHGYPSGGSVEFMIERLLLEQEESIQLRFIVDDELNKYLWEKHSSEKKIKYYDGFKMVPVASIMVWSQNEKDKSAEDLQEFIRGFSFTGPKLAGNNLRWPK